MSEEQVKEILGLIEKLEKFKENTNFGKDFLLTWDKSEDEIKMHLLVVDILRKMRVLNISPKIFQSGLGISLFRDQSTRTRFSFNSACNLLGLTQSDFDEKKSQVAHGETLRETANMITFMADIVGIRDDMYVGKGHKYMADFSAAVREGHKDGVLEQVPTIVNLQCDLDHPTQSLSDLNHMKHFLGGDLEKLKGKKVAMTWAYSPSYGKPLSVPQGVIGLMTRFGMDIVLAHPKGYELLSDTIDVANENVKKCGGSFKVTNDMKEAFKDADFVYPKSWAPFEAMKKRTDLYGNRDFEGIKKLEGELLTQNANHKDWTCTKEMMDLAKKNALYLHCLPADITGVSCEKGEVDADVFDKFRVPLYKQASHKPYVISSMIFLQKMKNPAKALKEILEKREKRLKE